MPPKSPISTIPVAGLGEMRLSACPGTWAGVADDVEAALEAELAHVRASGASGLVSLIERHEFPLGYEVFARKVAAAGLDWLHLPIRDFGVPGLEFERAYAQAGLLARIALGEVWSIHCRAGLGRTGTIAARLLVEAGSDPLAAIETIRSRHDRRAVETDGQRRYVLSCAPVSEADFSPVRQANP